MKNPINIAKKGYDKVLKIDDLVWRLEKLQQKQDELNTKIDFLHETEKTCLQKIDILEKQNIFLKELVIANTNIKNAPLPPPDSHIRLLQLSNLKLLQIFKDICEKYNIDFYLNFGSLLGAIRHKGFIPWDDDIDVMVIREDYNKLLQILKKEFKDTKLFYVHGDIIRLYYDKTPIQLDIFPSDFYQRPVKNETERVEIGKFLVNIHHKKIKMDWNKIYEYKSVITNLSYPEIEKLREQVGPDISKKEASKIHPAIYHGIEKSSIRKVRSVHDYDWIYPLKTIEFENLLMPIPNKPENLLDYYYGDYMSWPSKISPKHEDIQSRFNIETTRLLREITNGKINLMEKIK